MKDKEARVDIAGLEARVDYLNRKFDRLDNAVLESKMPRPTPACSEPDIMLRTRIGGFPERVGIPLSVFAQMLLNHLNLELTEERMVLKEIDNDNQT